MSKLAPDSLSNRQYDLNTRVNDAFTQDINFDTVKDETENSAVDKFFKIDLAAKCKNVNYIIEVLKSWEILFIKRALKKCEWLYSDEYCEIINPEYLHENIFAVTSIRAKRLILKTVVMNIRREDRAKAFFNYCMKMKMTDIALKCLLFTNEEFKMDLLLNQNKLLFDKIIHKKETYIRFIIGKSFPLLEAYVEKKKQLTSDHDETIRKFRYLYPIDNVKYLNLIEKYVYITHIHYDYTKKFDKQMCKDVMRKYKDRVLANPIFYKNIIPKEIILQNITTEEAKIIIFALLPSTDNSFWNCKFYHNEAKCYFDLIPHNEILEFIKKIFSDKYPSKEFETHKQFYMQGYYDLMTTAQQADWASKQIKSDKQVLGVGNDYLWYRFIHFEEAFEEIKKYIFVTKEPERRADMINTLVTSVRCDRDIETLCKYYKNRHINEHKVQKISFFDTVISRQNIFEFSDPCWTAFYTLLLSIELYNEEQNRDFDSDVEKYKTVTLFYHILNEKKIPEEIITFLLNDFAPSIGQQYLEKLDKQKVTFLFNYLHTFYTNQIKDLRNEPYSYALQLKSQKYFSVIVKLIRVFNVFEEKDEQKHAISTNKKIPSKPSLLTELKTKDKSYLIEKIPELKRKVKNWPNIESNAFLRKIKIYFKNDIAESLIAMCLSKLENEIPIKDTQGSTELETKACMYILFELGNEDVKVDLMKKYVPESEKIDFGNMETHLLDAQRAICLYAAKSLPPVPLTDMLKYMKGDYLKYSLHIFGVYIAALPASKCINLVDSVLDTPVSIQKHALRLAFECFSPECLKNISMDIWKKTKNVTLRSVIYKALFNRILNKNESELQDILISLTLDLHDDDQNIVFRLVLTKSNELPESFIGKYLKAAWQSISNFKNREPSLTRKSKVIRCIILHLNLVHNTDEEFVKSIIDEHLNEMFSECKLHLHYSSEDIAVLFRDKLNLTAEFIFNVICHHDPKKYAVELTEHIIHKCLDKWNETHYGEYIYQMYCWEFVHNINRKSLLCNSGRLPENLIPIYEKILNDLNTSLPLHEMYMNKWDIELMIANRRVMNKDRNNFEKDNKSEVINDSAMNFGKEVGKLVIEYVGNKSYFKTFSEKISFAVYKRVEELLKVILVQTGQNYRGHLNSALISVSVSLLQFEMAETHFLAVLLLPSDEREVEKYQFVIDSVMKFPDPEVQSCAHQKSLKANSQKKAKNFVKTNPEESRTTGRNFRGRGRGRRF